MKLLYTLTLALLSAAPLQAQYQDGLDIGFANKGLASYSSKIDFEDWELIDGALQADEKIVGLLVQKVMRFNSNGSVDKSFGKSGIFSEDLYYDGSVPLGANFVFSSLSLQTDGKMLVVGYADPGAPNKVLLLRLKTNGELDSSFGKNGVVCNADLGSEGIRGYGITTQTDGKILVLASVAHDFYQVLARYKPDGSLDSSFGTNGRVTNTKAKTNINKDIEVLADGKILALYQGFGVARYLPDGRLDTAFNHTGMATAVPAPYSHAMAVQADGKILVAGYTAFLSPGPYIVGRLNADGSTDSSFAGIGYTSFDWAAGDYNKCFDILLLPDGRFVLGGQAGNPGTGYDNFGLIRVQPDGSIDNTYGDKGRLLTAPFGNKNYGANANKLLLQPDGKILALGVSKHQDYGLTNFALIARYYKNPTGLYDKDEAPPQIALYPNPATNRLYIDIPDQYTLERISIRSLGGALLRQFSKPLTNEIDISGLPEACYMVTILTNDLKQFHQKLNISH